MKVRAENAKKFVDFEKSESLADGTSGHSGATVLCEIFHKVDNDTLGRKW